MPEDNSLKGEPQQVTGTATLNIKVDPLLHFLSQPNKPSFYANGFQAGLTPSECYLIFNQNNMQKVSITLPIPAIKTLREILQKMESDYEERFGTKIKSTNELNAYNSPDKK